MARTITHTPSRNLRGIPVFAMAVGVLLLLCTALPSAAQTAPGDDCSGFETVFDPALQFFAERGLSGTDPLPGDLAGMDLDELHVLDHVIPLSGGRTIHALEAFTLRSWLQLPVRASLFLNGSAFVGNHWNIPVDGYDGGKILAEEGYFAFSVDYLGTGRSFTPDDGRNAEYEDNREAMKTVLRYVRCFRDAHGIDLIGAGYGGAMATELAADPVRVRSVSLSAMIYEEVQGGPLNDPGFVAFLSSIPDAYVLLPGRSSLIFMQGAPEEARNYVQVTQGDFYPVDNFLAAADRPFFDPSVAKAPGLILYGGQDFIAVRSDVVQLAADYGVNGAELVIKEDAGHAPRAGSPAEASWYWSQVLDFLANPHAP